MMKKSFCDKCSDEMTDKNSFNSLIFNVASFNFKLTLPDAVTSDQDICKYCVIDAINNLDDRPTCRPTCVEVNTKSHAECSAK